MTVFFLLCCRTLLCHSLLFLVMSERVLSAVSSGTLTQLLSSLATLSFVESLHLSVALYTSGALSEAIKSATHAASLRPHSLVASEYLKYATKLHDHGVRDSSPYDTEPAKAFQAFISEGGNAPMYVYIADLAVRTAQHTYLITSQVYPSESAPLWRAFFLPCR